MRNLREQIPLRWILSGIVGRIVGWMNISEDNKLSLLYYRCSRSQELIPYIICKQPCNVRLKPVLEKAYTSTEPHLKHKRQVPNQSKQITGYHSTSQQCIWNTDSSIFNGQLKNYQASLRGLIIQWTISTKSSYSRLGLTNTGSLCTTRLLPRWRLDEDFPGTKNFTEQYLISMLAITI